MNGTLTPGTQLPSETELAAELGISRTTLREALNILQQEGTIIRRQGVGTFLTRQPLLPNRLDINLGVTELIQSMGLEAGIGAMDAKTIPADDQCAAHLDVPEGTPLIDLQRIRTADGKPVVLSRDIFPLSLLAQGRHLLTVDRLQDLLRTESSLYKVMQTYLGLTIDYGITKIRPISAEASIAQKLMVPEGSVLMYLEQVDYDAAGQPLLASQEYHVADVYTFSVYRKR